MIVGLAACPVPLLVSVNCTRRMLPVTAVKAAVEPQPALAARFPATGTVPVIEQSPNACPTTVTVAFAGLKWFSPQSSKYWPPEAMLRATPADGAVQLALKEERTPPVNTNNGTSPAPVAVQVTPKKVQVGIARYSSDRIIVRLTGLGIDGHIPY